MIGWLSLKDEQRRITLEQASVRSGIQPKAIEKDWWVTFCLKALFSTPYGKYCIFKGGTSLSKGWKLIQRFSEDIDIALDPQAFGMPYITEPSHSIVKKMKREGCKFTSTLMLEAIAHAMDLLGMPQQSGITITAEEVRPEQPDKDPQTLFIRYPSLFDAHPYLADEVKMEFGVRALKEPYTCISVQSILNEYFPNEIYGEMPFEVMAVEPRKTLLEKIFLLHEKFLFPYKESTKGDRQSRHLYDIAQLIKTPAGQEVLEDHEFYTTLLEHRRHYVRLSGVDYDTLDSATINFIPDIILQLEVFKKDYATMQESMIYVDSPSFEELMEELKLYNGKLRLIGTSLKLEDLIRNFLEEHRKVLDGDPGKNILHSLLETQTPAGKAIVFHIEMHRKLDRWLFESIKFAKPAPSSIQDNMKIFN